MGFFNGVDADEPQARGLFAKFRGWRAGFVESAPADTLPIVGAEPSLSEPDTPRFRSASQAVNPQMVTLGMRLRGEDVMDVEARDSDGIMVERIDFASKATHSGSVEPERDVSGAQTVDDASTDDLAREHAMASAIVKAGAAPVDDLLCDAASPPVVPVAASLDAPAWPEATALVDTGTVISPSGLPRLVSVEALPAFKRILCEASPDAALRIIAAARRQFVAVDIQAGVAIVVTTVAFHETSLYATYLKDLARADIAVREEMIATEEVIAAVYAREKNRSAAVIPESSRAIGTFRDVIEAANGYDASDVHWEYRDFNDEVEVRFRVNGDLYTYRNMPKSLVRRALSASYQDLVQRNTNSGETFQPSAPQSAMIPLATHRDMLNIRWQSTPLVGGFDVALRLLDGNFRHYKVRLPQDMGLEASQLEIVKALGNVSGGVTVLTGETGSAKTTLLRALSYLFAARDLRKQFAVNEPSEYPQPWLSDISIQRRPDETDEEASRKCAEVIRSLMRMDPDDLTVGEIRDHVVAGLVAELALTGHPVRTSLHADSAIGAFMRLAGGRLQVPMDELASEKFINAVGNQKLIPLLCPHCKKPAKDVMPAPHLELLRTRFGLDTSQMACRDEAGCEHCRLKGLLTRDGKVAAGTRGQTLAMELFRPSPEFLEHVAKRDWRGAEKVWRSERTSGFGDADMTGKTIYEHALYKAAQGLIDPRFIDEKMRTFANYRVFADRDGRLPS
ncbi:MAG: Flp pilus assembly complex ATPase component TadA [Burkholderiales bacterium]|nr:Flp pilus assembly complex ATPase component TadA [Burkholderiales bacterium]